MEWKTALYDFMHNRNETEADYDPVHVSAGVMDDRFLEAEASRQQRRRELARSRGLSQTRSETRLKLYSARTEDGMVWADVGWHRLSEYRLAQRAHREESLMRERIGLSLRGNRWIVRRVEAAEPDERAAQRHGSFNGASQELLKPRQQRSPSLPLLNRDLVTPPIDYEVIRRTRYDRERAKDYAELWWNDANPAYLHFEVDCSNYVSQCLFAGEAPMDYTGKRERGWWYQGKSGSKELWSFSWAVANSLRMYLASNRQGLRGVQVDAPDKLAIGDVISYSFDGSGRFGHSSIVTAFDGNGMPLVNAHTVNCRGRYWDYKDSYAWTERTMYRFFHIPDEL